MRRPPGFAADRTLAPPVRPTGGQPGGPGPSKMVTAAQSVSSLNALRALAVRRPSGPLYVYPGIDCPPGQRPVLENQCTASLPEYECTFLGNGQFDCYVKAWHCLGHRQVWGCKPIELTVFNG